MPAEQATDKTINEWSFPDVEIFKGPDEEKKAAKIAMNKLIQEQTSVKNDLEKIKNEYQSKLNTVNQIFQIIEDPIAILNDEIIKIFHEILIKTAKKIILKEITTDPEIFKNMVAEIRSLFKSEKNIITIAVSKEDAALFESDKANLGFVLDADETLNRGDVVAKSKVSEIHALLDERINQLIKVNYD